MQHGLEIAAALSTKPNNRVYTLRRWCARDTLRAFRNPGATPAGEGGAFMHPAGSTMLDRPRERVQTKRVYFFLLLFLLFGMCHRIGYRFRGS